MEENQLDSGTSLESKTNTEFDPKEHAREQVDKRTKLVKDLEVVYNKTHKEIKKQQIMIDYYKRQL